MYTPVHVNSFFDYSADSILKSRYCRGAEKFLFLIIIMRSCECNVKLSFPRACLKNHSRNLYALLCGIFHPNSIAVARATVPSSERNLPQIVMQITGMIFSHASEQQ